MKERNLPIEGLRGLLATFVLVYHVIEMGSKAGWYWNTDAYIVTAEVGVYAVSLFFCISGYLIVQSLVVKGSVLSFLRNRAVRIYPVFMVLQIAIFTLGPVFGYRWMVSLRGHPLSWVGNFVSNLLFLPGVFNLPLAQMNAWSLSYEALFYLSAAALFFTVTRRWWPIFGILVISGVLVIALRPLCIFFLVGYSAFLIQQRYQLSSKFKTQLGRWSLPSLFLGAFLFAVHPLLSVPFVLVAFYAVAWRAGLLSRWLERKELLFLGRISFSLYLVHPFVLDPLRTLCKHLTNSHLLLARLAFPSVGIPLAIAVSAFSWWAIEQRFTRVLLHRKGNDVITSSRRGEPSTLPLK